MTVRQNRVKLKELEGGGKGRGGGGGGGILGILSCMRTLRKHGGVQVREQNYFDLFRLTLWQDLQLVLQVIRMCSPLTIEEVWWCAGARAGSDSDVSVQ